MENYRLGTAQTPSRTCCPSQASPLHSQWHPGGPQGHDQALEHSSAAVVPEPWSAPAHAQGEMACWGCPCSTSVRGDTQGHPHPAWGCRLEAPALSPVTYRTSSPRRARKAPSSMQLIWFLSSCLKEKGKKRENCWDSPGREQSVLPIFCCLLPLDLTPNSLMPNTARTHRFLRSVAPRNAFLGMAWMRFSLRSLQKKEAGRQMGSACKV